MLRTFPWKGCTEDICFYGSTCPDSFPDPPFAMVHLFSYKSKLRPLRASLSDFVPSVVDSSYFSISCLREALRASNSCILWDCQDRSPMLTSPPRTTSSTAVRSVTASLLEGRQGRLLQEEAGSRAVLWQSMRKEETRRTMNNRFYAFHTILCICTLPVHVLFPCKTIQERNRRHSFHQKLILETL